MEEYQNVAVIRCGKEIRIVVTMTCPYCGGEVAYIWQGEPKKIYPKFLDNGECSGCQRVVPGKPPKKSVLRWWWLAKMEIKNVWKDEVNKYVPKMKINGKNKRKRKRKKNKKELESAKQKLYGNILRQTG